MSYSAFSSTYKQAWQVMTQATGVYMFIAIIHSVSLCLVTAVVLFISLVNPWQIT